MMAARTIMRRDACACLANIADAPRPWTRAARQCTRRPSRFSASPTPASVYAYHSISIPTQPPPYQSAVFKILSAAHQYVPVHGFTQFAMIKGIENAGYSPPSLSLFPRGTFELVMFHLITQRLGLRKKMPWLAMIQNGSSHAKGDVASSVHYALLARLRANIPIIHHLPEAIALMSLTKNVSSSLLELGRLADEILCLAGNVSVDSTWYLGRSAVAAVYASTELFMTQDQSSDFTDTEDFLSRRLEDLRVTRQNATDIGEYLGFAAMSLVHIARSRNAHV